jgi:hypothetical protein
MKLMGIFVIGAVVFVLLCIAGDTGGATWIGVDARGTTGDCKGIVTKTGAGAGAGAGAGISGISNTSLIIISGICDGLRDTISAVT